MVKNRAGTRARLGPSSGLQPGCELISGDGWQTALDRRSFGHRVQRVPWRGARFWFVIRVLHKADGLVAARRVVSHVPANKPCLERFNVCRLCGL